MLESWFTENTIEHQCKSVANVPILKQLLFIHSEPFFTAWMIEKNVFCCLVFTKQNVPKLSFGLAWWIHSSLWNRCLCSAHLVQFFRVLREPFFVVSFTVNFIPLQPMLCFSFLVLLYLYVVGGQKWNWSFFGSLVVFFSDQPRCHWKMRSKAVWWKDRRVLWLPVVLFLYSWFRRWAQIWFVVVLDSEWIWKQTRP